MLSLKHLKTKKNVIIIIHTLSLRYGSGVLGQQLHGPVDLLHARQKGQHVAGLLGLVDLQGRVDDGPYVIGTGLGEIQDADRVEPALDGQDRRRVLVGLARARVEEVPELLGVDRRRGHDGSEAAALLLIFRVDWGFLAFCV